LRFITMDVPGKSGILSPELYEREKEKFQTLMEETRELATVALREEFAGIVRHMVERLSGDEDGKPKRFQASMLGKTGEFLDPFGDRNLFADDKLPSSWIRPGKLSAGYRRRNCGRTEICGNTSTTRWTSCELRSMVPWRICLEGRLGWRLETMRLGIGRFPAPSLYFFLLPFVENA